ncbi:MAG: sigma-70 family RNA polymerase sigma factor [Methyloligellaceae bacterium]
MNRATTDQDLIGRIARRDRAAVEVLYGRHHVRVYRFAMRFVRNEAVAEELVNDVFLDIWRHADRFDGRSSVTTWMLAMVRNKAISLLRRRSEEGLDEQMARNIEDRSDDPEVAAQKGDKGLMIRQCMEKLSADHREVIDLVYYHEKSVREVSEITGTSESTVKTRMYYARKQLGELLKDAGIDRGWP